MEPWGWLVGYVVLFALLHLVLYYVYARQEGSDRQAGSFAEGTGYSTPDGLAWHREDGGDERGRHRREDGDDALDDDALRCPHCGRPNEADPAYTYCWNCVSTLQR